MHRAGLRRIATQRLRRVAILGSRLTMCPLKTVGDKTIHEHPTQKTLAQAAAAFQQGIQKDLRAQDQDHIEQWRRCVPGANLSLPLDELSDFRDSAALVSQLIHVISVDTSTAHLPGVLGISTALLLPAMPDWRWQLDRADTPWYGSGNVGSDAAMRIDPAMAVCPNT